MPVLDSPVEPFSFQISPIFKLFPISRLEAGSRLNWSDRPVNHGTNAIFLENDYMNDYTPRNRVILSKMNEPIVE